MVVWCKKELAEHQSYCVHIFILNKSQTILINVESWFSKQIDLYFIEFHFFPSFNARRKVFKQNMERISFFVLNDQVYKREKSNNIDFATTGKQFDHFCLLGGVFKTFYSIHSFIGL